MPGPVRNPTEAFQQLEAIMLRQMLQSSGAFKASDSPGAQVRTDMFVETLAAAVAKAGGLGIARMLEHQLGATPGTAAPTGAAASQGPTFQPTHAAYAATPRLPASGGATSSAALNGLDDLDDPNSEAPLPEDPSAASIDDYQQSGTTRPGAGAGTAAQEVTAEVTSGFGPRIHPITHDQRFHTGIDLRAAEGAPIHAAAGGVVSEAGRRGGYGNTVQIDHGNGTSTLYAHASALLVEKGQRVEPGQPVALVGQTGQATGPHLHFEVRRYDHPINPTSGNVPISITRALNRYRERAEAPHAGTPPGAGDGDTP